MARSVSEAVAADDMRDALKAMAAKLAADFELADPSVSAQVAGQLRQVLKDLQALPVAKGVPKRDELRDRREARRTAPPVAPDAAKGGRKRG